MRTGRRRSSSGSRAARRPTVLSRRRWPTARSPARGRSVRIRRKPCTRDPAASTRPRTLFASRRATWAVAAFAIAICSATAFAQRSAKALAERHAATAIGATSRSFDAANDAWERGDYIAALNGYIQLLTAPGGDQYVDLVALTTGELFQTREITADGRAPRFSPDGKFIVYETGLETSRRTKILRNDEKRAAVVELPGVSATFSTALAQVAYLKIPDNDEI